MSLSHPEVEFPLKAVPDTWLLSKLPEAAIQGYFKQLRLPSLLIMEP